VSGRSQSRGRGTRAADDEEYLTVRSLFSGKAY
jgi:hypothetical protein